jgi:mono/diheme cytochrome c family protein
MFQTNLKIVLVGALTLGFYTFFAQIIPQLESDVPATLDLSGGVTPEILIASGEDLFNGAGACVSCHGLGERAPNLLTDHNGEGTIGERCATRVPGQDCKTYLYESMTNPAGYLVGGFDPIMLDVSRQLSPAQIWALVAFLESQGGAVTVTADDIQVAADAAGTTSGGGGFSASTDPMELMTESACFTCHGIDGAESLIGPSFDGMGSRISADRIRQSLLDPGAEIAEGFVGPTTMPAYFGQQFSAQQLEIIVQFLAGRR